MGVTSVHKDFERLTLTVVADFDAPVERVWRLWADPWLVGMGATDLFVQAVGQVGALLAELPAPPPGLPGARRRRSDARPTPKERHPRWN